LAAVLADVAEPDDELPPQAATRMDTAASATSQWKRFIETSPLVTTEARDGRARAVRRRSRHDQHGRSFGKYLNKMTISGLVLAFNEATDRRFFF
jgi:hypothetical protein